MNTFKGRFSLLSLLFSSSLQLQAWQLEHIFLPHQPNDLVNKQILQIHLRPILDIQWERNKIEKKGRKLLAKKDAALNRDPLLSTLDPSYDDKMLSLIKDILENYQRGEEICAPVLVKEEWARGSLRNLVISAGSLTKWPQAEYENQVPGFEGGNFWRDVEFLSLFFRQNNQTELSYPMVKAWMESQSFQQLICKGEIASQNHLLVLYPFISHKRERYVLQKAIECIDHVENLTKKTTYDIETQDVLLKGSVLRAFVVIGEACTQKNLSPYTKALEVANFDWSLLIHIRDKIAHPEHDIHSSNLEKYFEKNDVHALIPELQKIKNIFEKINLKLDGLTYDQRDNHYLNKSTIALLEGPSVDLSLLKKFYAKLKTKENDQTLKSTRATKIQADVKLLEKIFKIPGKEALSDDFPEDNTNVPSAVLQRRTVLAKSLLKDPERIDAGFHYVARIGSLLNSLYIDQLLKPVKKNSSKKDLSKELEQRRQMRIESLWKDPKRILSANKKYIKNPAFKDFHDQAADLDQLDFKGYQNFLEKNEQCTETIGKKYKDFKSLFGKINSFMKIAKFLETDLPEDLLKKHLDFLDKYLPILEEYHAFRNFVQHGDMIVESLGIEPAILLIRYTHILLHKLMPILREYPAFELKS